MQLEPNEIKMTLDDLIAQRAIIWQVTREDHPRGWTRAELESEIHEVEPQTISKAFAELKAEGVVEIKGKQVRRSRATRRLDLLGMPAK